ncbi:MAG TPA: glycosyltransferase [Clostridia bacterium]|nr:glycosyltransferase [Clostridia bacterium]
MANLATNKKFNLLQIGCGGGGTLISIKSIFPDSCLYGMEKHGELLINLTKYANVIAEDAVQTEFTYEPCTFDFVVITDDNLGEDRLVSVIKKTSPILKQDGCLIISSVPGNNLEQLISECFKGYTSVNCMSYENHGRVNLCIKDFEKASPVLPQEYSGQPLISICIPTYNRAKDLDTCLCSIFSQIGSSSLFEVVVINNDSKDNTEDIISKYALAHTNLVHQKNPVNIGPEKNYLKALDSAKGEYLLLHGDDDFFADGSLNRLFNTVKRNRDKSIIFIDVLHDDKKEIPVKSLDDFIYLETGTSSAFITSIMLKSSEYHKIEDKEKFLGSELNQVYLLFTIIEGNSNGCVVNDSMFRYASNLSGGYEWPRIFIQGYLELLDYFRSRGSISEEMIRFEKERMLKQNILKWFVIFSRENRLKEFGMECLDKYLLKYYNCEPYFQEFYKTIKAIRSGKIQL